MFLLKFNNSYYWVNLYKKNSVLVLSKHCNHYFGSLITNDFQTPIGGIPYYDYLVKHQLIATNNVLSFVNRLDTKFNGLELKKLQFNKDQINKQPLRFISRSLIWLPEETYKLNCDRSMLLVEHGNFISGNFELIPGLFSKKIKILISGIFPYSKII